MRSTMIYMFLILGIALLIDYYIYDYLKEINERDCECADSKENLYIRNYLLFSISTKIFTYLFVFLIIILHKTFIFKTKPFLFLLALYSSFITFIYPILHFIYYYALYSYVNDIKECECANDDKTKFIYIYLVIAVVFFVFQFLGTTFKNYRLFTMKRNKKK